jgi:hypothetical protein
MHSRTLTSCQSRETTIEESVMTSNVAGGSNGNLDHQRNNAARQAGECPLDAENSNSTHVHKAMVSGMAFSPTMVPNLVGRLLEVIHALDGNLTLFWHPPMEWHATDSHNPWNSGPKKKRSCIDYVSRGGDGNG